MGSTAVLESTVQAVLARGTAILKTIAPNDVKLPGSHQTGYYLPKDPWKLFAPFGPVHGRNDESAVMVTWHDGTITNSRVKWYGKAKSEYRLTSFGQGFPFREPEYVGSLLVLVPESLVNFKAFILETDDDIESLQSELGHEHLATWSVYSAKPGAISVAAKFRECFGSMVRGMTELPSGAWFHQRTMAAIEECDPALMLAVADARLVRCFELEYSLFRLAEEQTCNAVVGRPFKSIEEFLSSALAIINRRKSRAGRSFENHFCKLLDRAGIPYDRTPSIEGRPDVVIPGERAYRSKTYSVERLFVVGLKTTCKDRWRQVLREAPRVSKRYIATIQRGVSPGQLREMATAGVSLIVPKELHQYYVTNKTGIELLTVEGFLGMVTSTLDPSLLRRPELTGPTDGGSVVPS
jgi:type II restriction enzyme